MEIVVSAQAQEEIRHAVSEYEIHRKGLGERLYGEFVSDTTLIAEFPDAFPVKDFDTRMKPLKTFPYTIFYHVGIDVITILAFTHTKRLPYYWKNRQ